MARESLTLDAMGHRAAPPAPDGVLALLRALRTSVYPQEAQPTLRTLLPAYERLLRPDASTEDHGVRTMRELQRVRAILKSEPDLFNVAQTLDVCVDRCLELDDTPHGSGGWSMSDALRLVLALAGGSDGATFVLEDPTRVQLGGPLPYRRATPTQRLGERIQMSNVDIITQTQHTLLRSAALPLATEDVLGQYDFASFEPKSAREATLWYPDRNAQGGMLGERDEATPTPSTTFDSLFQQLQGGNSAVPRLIDLPQISQQDALFRCTPTKKGNLARSRVRNASPSGIDTEVFFFDASKVISAVPLEHFDEESVTDASTKGNEDVQSVASWSAVLSRAPPTATWEELGATEPTVAANGSLSVFHMKNADPLAQPLPMCICQTPAGTTVVDVEEADIVEYAAKALCGIESVVFRRDVTTASLRLPNKMVMKMATVTPSSLMSILEEFRLAGTAFLRVEYLSIYYGQDPSRGGKTCQAFADALALYLAAYQKSIMNHVEATGEASYFVSLATMLTKTRNVRRQLLGVCGALKCSTDLGSDYWRLLSGGEFPRGVELLNLLHCELRECECSDATGETTLLWRWLLVRAAQPFVSLVSSYVASGQTPLELDPHSEFQLSIFSTLQALEEARDVSNGCKEDIVPHFLEESYSRIIRIGRLQHMLYSILPHTDLLPADTLRLPLQVSEAQTQLDPTRSLLRELEKRVEALCSQNTQSTILRRPLRSPIKSPRSEDDRDSEWTAVKRKRLDHTRTTQDAQREMLDQSMRERVVAQAERDKHGAEAGALLTSIEYAQLECGKELLMSKYAPLMSDDDDRLKYMKWRHDRATSLTSTKIELAQLLEREQEQWRTARDHPSSTDWATRKQNLPANQGIDQFEASDVVMEDIHDESHSVLMVPQCDPAVSTQAADIVDDGGLLWRPRVRVQNVPGGGGSDAMAMLYPDRDISQNGVSAGALARHRSSVVITKIDRKEGSAAYESIYGGGITSVNQSQQKGARNAGHGGHLSTDGTVSLTAHEDKQSTAPSVDMEITTVDELSPALTTGSKDIDMTSHEEEDLRNREPVGAGDHDSVSGLVRLSLPVTPDALCANSNPVLAILHSTTNFLRGDISSEDCRTLKAILHTQASTLSTPFRSLSDLALADPITVIHDFVDRMALKAMIVKLDLKSHLNWLHRVALMSEGLCMTIFTRDLFNELRSNFRVLLALPGRLTTSLALAMIEARLVTSAAHVPSFAYRVENDFVTAVSSGPSIPSMVEALKHITLTYDISIHLLAVLTPKAIANYQRVHQSLLLMRLTEHETKEIWLDWRKSSLRSGTQTASTRRLCDLVLHFAQMVLNAFLETFTHHVLEAKWRDFVNAIDNASSVSTLRVAHEEFARDAASCCFLQEGQIEILNNFHTFIECAWSLGKLIRAAEKHGESMDPFLPKLNDVSEAQTKAMNALTTHLYRLESSTDHGMRDFAKHFLLRLNLNGFFSDTTVSSYQD